jgi:hypothetical protein
VTLQRTPTDANHIRLYDESGFAAPGVPLTQAGATAANTNYNVTTLPTLVIGGGLMGHTLRAVYSYAPTYTEVLSRFHQASVNFDNVNTLLEQVSIGGGIGSEIYTNFWEPSNSPAAGTFCLGGAVYLGSNGKFVPIAQAGGTATKIGRVIHAPTADDTTLGFRVIAEE